MKGQGEECIRCGSPVPHRSSLCSNCIAGRTTRKKISFQEAIERNRRASFLLSALLIFTGIMLGFAIGKAHGHPLAGIMLALTIFAILTIVTMTSGKNIPLMVNGATRADGEADKLVTNIIEELKIASGLEEIPEVYVIDDDSINAFASALSQSEAAIAVTKGAMNRLTRDELQSVLAHEVSHILSNDSRYFLILSVIVGSIVMISDLFLRIGLFSRRTRYSYGWLVPAIILALFSPLFITILRLSISREREFLADARAVKITRNPSALASALQKTSDSVLGVKKVNRATRHLFIVNPSAVKRGKNSALFSTHPPVEERIKRLRMMGARFF